MSIEPVVRHDSSQIGMIREEDAKHVVDFTLIPVCTVVQRCDRGHRRGFVRISLDPYPRVVRDAEHVVDDLETVLAGREIDGRDIRHHGVLCGVVVLEKREDRDNSLGGDVDGKLVLPDGVLLDEFGKAGHEIFAIGVQLLGLSGIFVGRVDDRGS